MARFGFATLAAFLLFGTLAFGQGILPFKTTQNIGADIVDLSTLNVLVSPTFRSKSGRFSVGATINSSVGRNVSNGTTAEAHLGQLANGSVTNVPCPNGTTTLKYFLYSYADQSGAVHYFIVQTDPKQCLTPILSASATDGSGYTIVLTPGMDWTGATVYDKDGGAHRGNNNGVQATKTYTGPNGTTIAETCQISTGACAYTDIFNTTAFSDTANDSVGSTGSYVDATGVQRNTTETTLSAQIQTPCTTGGIGANLLTNITFPDNSQLQLTWELKTGTTFYTGRLASMTLRTGGTTTYTYSGGTGGENCSDGTTATLTRHTPDGTWTYVHTLGTGNVSTTIMTDPSGNDTVYTFASGYEIYRQGYQGSSTAGTLLISVGTCYNGTISCQSQTSVTSPITEVDAYTTIPGIFNTSSVRNTYNSYGLLTRERKFGFGAASPTVDTNIAYGTYSGGSCIAIGNFIVDRPCSLVVKDGSGVVKAQTNYTYDAHGNALSFARLVSGSTYLTTSATHNANGSVATQTDANGAVTTFSNFTCNGLLAQSIAPPLGLTSSQTWDCNGDVLTSKTDPNNQVSQVNYVVNSVGDPIYRPLGITDPLGNFTNLKYYSPNADETYMIFNGTSITDSSRHYDSLGRLDILQHEQGAPPVATFDSRQTSYDASGRVAQTTRPYVGSIYQAAQAGTPFTAYTYDALDRPLTATINGTGPTAGGTTTYSYNAGDILVTVGPAPTGEHTKQRQYEYDGLGRLTSVCEITNATGSGPCSQRNSAGLNFTTGYLTTYTYDTQGKLLTVQQNKQGSPVQTRTYVYDALSRITSETNPESGTTTYTYDTVAGNYCTNASSYTSAGDLVARADANGSHICYNYDQIHRVTDVGNNNQSATNPCKRFRYDNTTGVLGTIPTGVTVNYPRGRAAESETDTCAWPVTSASIITDEWFSYSARGELTDVYESTPHSGGYYHVSTSYFPNGALQALNGIGNGFNYGFGVDGEGRLNYGALTNSTLTHYVGNVTYNAASQPLTVLFASGDNDTYAYDANTNRMSGYTFTVGSALTSTAGALTWNANGTLSKLAITDGFNSGGTQTCKYGDPTASVAGYDDLSRLISANCGTPWTQTFSYDPFGNITKTGSIAWQPGYNQSNNRYILAGTTYDADGNLLTDTFHTYNWNVYGRPATIDGTTTLTYDANNVLVEKNSSGSYTEIEYGPTGKTCTMNGTAQVQCITPLPGGSSLARGPETIWHPDWLGSIRLGSSPISRTITFDRAFAPFGETYSTITGGTTNLAFTGLTQDSISGEYDTPNRLQNPSQGRWISPDPAGLGAADTGSPQTWNRYAYVGNDPLTGIDPLGLIRDPDDRMNAFFFLGGGGFNCTMDGLDVSCDSVNMSLESGAAVRCPNDQCVSDVGGVPAYFKAYLTGSGYDPYFGPGFGFPTEDQALIAASMYAQNQSLLNTGNEQCGMTYASGDNFSYTQPKEGTHDGCQPLDQMGKVPAGDVADGGYHSHGVYDPAYDNDRFSGQPGDRGPGDVAWARATGFPLSLATPGGNVIVYYPNAGCQTFFLGSPIGTGTTLPVCP